MFPLFADSGATTAVILVALVFVIGWVLFRTYSRLSRQRQLDNQPLRHGRSDAGRSDPGHYTEGPPEEVLWEVRMHELARDLSAQLDSKMRALQALIADADRAAARLESASTPTADKPQPPPAEAESSDSFLPQHREEVHTLADYGFPAAEIASRLGVPVGEVDRILGLRKKE